MQTISATAQTLLTLGGISVVLLIFHVLAQGQLASREFGTQYNAGPRDEGKRPQSVFAGRGERASKNFRETYPGFVFLVLALALSGEETSLGLAGAWIWLLARIVYYPLYLAGVPYFRSIAWLISIAALLMMTVALIF